MSPFLPNLGKGAIVGASMLIPGVSGGTMAILLGMYDRLVKAVSHFFQNWKDSLWLLVPFSLGGILGMVLFSRLLLSVIHRFEFPAMYFFLGAIAASIPPLFQKTKAKLSASSLLFMLLGVGLVMGISLLPSDLLRYGDTNPFLLFFAGILVAIALVLPGISASYLLLLLGIYQPVLLAIAELRISYLLPLGTGGILGILLTTRLLDRAMEKYPHHTFSLIIGFVLASTADVFPGIPSLSLLLPCLLTFFLGFGAVFQLSKAK